MFELLRIGEKFIATLSDIGDALITFRLSNMFAFASDIPVLNDIVDAIVFALGNPSLAELLFGSFLITIIAIKLFKFFKDIFV